MSVIRILTEAVANKIAAGEVVERPASVVKELLENALDAGASRVEVDVEAGGKRLIRVIDNGCGMSHDDALLAFERHATSKIRSADDLFAISTLGFRGEALPSIAAVSRLLLETRHASENSGSRIEFSGGKLRDVKETAWSPGTSIEVRDLFFNTPARRKFLRSESTELSHVAGLVTHYALAHPDKSFRLASLTNEILNVAPVATRRERVYQVMGGQTLDRLVEISPAERALPVSSNWPDWPDRRQGPEGPQGQSLLEESEPGQTAEGSEGISVVCVSGFVSRPEVQKLNRNHIYFFVNRRLVRDRLILHAITEAYHNILPASVFPVALLFLDLPAGEVDVNVHPSKTEVRFRHSRFTHDLVRDAIRQALIATRPVAAFPLQEGKPLGLSGEDQPTSRAPAGAFPLPTRGGSPEQASEAAEVAETLSEEPPLMKGAALLEDFPAIRATSANFELSPAQPKPQPGRLPLGGALSLDPPTTGGLESVPARITDEFPTDLEPLGQVRESFIVAANARGLWIVDQHVAHERILFERHLRLRAEKRLEVQRLLLPIIVELKADQQARFLETAAELLANGFEAEPFGQRTIALKTAPVDVPHTEVERLVVEILDSVVSETGEMEETGAMGMGDLDRKIAASVACHAAIKVNTQLDRAKMQWLLRELGATQCPMSCPHGRPVILRYSLTEIEKAFKRS